MEDLDSNRFLRGQISQHQHLVVEGMKEEGRGRMAKQIRRQWKTLKEKPIYFDAKKQKDKIVLSFHFQ